MSRREGKISIIVAVIGLIGVIGAAIIGAKWGKENVTVIVQLDGKNVVLNNEDVKKMAKENGSSRVMVGKKYPQPQCLC